MFPADCLPTHYVETRTQQDLAHQKALAAAEKKPSSHLLAQPTPQRPTMTRALSSALFSFFPSSAAGASPSATPLPSPGLQQSAKMGWFAPLPKASESDIAVSILLFTSFLNAMLTWGNSVFLLLGLRCMSYATYETGDMDANDVCKRSSYEPFSFYDDRDVAKHIFIDDFSSKNHNVAIIGWNMGWKKWGTERTALGKCIDNNDEMQTWTYYLYNVSMTKRKT